MHKNQPYLSLIFLFVCLLLYWIQSEFIVLPITSRTHFSCVNCVLYQLQLYCTREYRGKTSEVTYNKPLYCKCRFEQVCLIFLTHGRSCRFLHSLWSPWLYLVSFVTKSAMGTKGGVLHWWWQRSQKHANKLLACLHLPTLHHVCNKYC